MATEDTEIEEGGQTEDTGESTEETEVETEGGEARAANDNGDEQKGKPGSRSQRRANRFAEERAARTRAEQELSELRGRYSGLESQFNEFRQTIERDRQQAQQSDASKQTRSKIAAVREQAWTYLAAAADPKNAANARELRDKYQELMDEADDMRDEMRDSARWEKRRGEIAGQLPNQELMTERTYLEGRYPWIATNAEARALADAKFNTLVSQGKPTNRTTMEAALTYAARVLGIGGQSAPTARSRQVYDGRGQRDGEMDDSAPSGAMTAEDVKNNLSLKRMAQLSYPEEEPEVAYVKFAKMQNSQSKNGVSAR